MVAQAPAEQDAVVIGEVHLARIEEVRRGWPFLRDRRIDAYAGLSSRFLDQQSSAVSHQPSARTRNSDS
jgi:N-carbamoylputrescine amidase